MPEDKISIQTMSIEDYARVIGLWRSMDGVGLSAADEKESIAKYLDRNPGMSFTARVNGKIVGAVLAGHDGRRGYLHHLAVQPLYGRQGLGRALVRAALVSLEREGIQKCHIFIFADNETGRAFWKKTGFDLRDDLIIMSENIGG